MGNSIVPSADGGSEHPETSELEAARLKTARYDTLMNACGRICLTDLADLLDVHITTLTEWLVEQNIFRVSGRGALPRPEYQASGHFEIEKRRRSLVTFSIIYATSTGLDLVLSRWTKSPTV